MKGVPTIIAVGEIFKRLTVTGLAFTEIRETGSGFRRYRYYPCICKCGNEKKVTAFDLTDGRIKSCGCWREESRRSACRTHGCSGTRIYIEFTAMKSRCYRKNGDDYKNYGGRGITVCDEWRTDFPAFRDWAMANGYRDDLTLERKDNDLGYSPENCTWIPNADQWRNRRFLHMVFYQGETKCLADWCRDPRCTVNYKVFRQRIRKGWPFDKAFMTPRIPDGHRPRSIGVRTTETGHAMS